MVLHMKPEDHVIIECGVMFLYRQNVAAQLCNVL